ncbi:N-acetylmuramoyl-L-alanine amidase [Pseudoalteromonas sp. A601]|uniref:1,6-anhydro-N-acetylmuramyl-L-alanine amidase AmpD n=1 Tax=Pseudoalteromonas sp. A601 TaxID=1967839 RepID=UPI000B3CC0D6|nr:1,6-anhydro-N-acetylmuramyl-L-alanine amidase AmpD [Pseudoalteromonas sp. A601]OUS74274.1 N-acetylmuramoyl-L-alanine amidase [Pseudoalteromonas sp. A601]
MYIDNAGKVQGVIQRACTHFDERPCAEDISLLVIHNISLPAGHFATPYVDDLFMGNIDCLAHPSFSDLQGLRVSAHCFIKRTGEVIQYVPFTKRAWHAGKSDFLGREQCNDFSIGIELEGTDVSGYTQMQYNALQSLTKLLMNKYPAITKKRIVGHCDIAPGRKTDPGESFDWQHYLAALF